MQLVMEDFPRKGIKLTQTNGSKEVKTTNDAISKIPVQFVLQGKTPCYDTEFIVNLHSMKIIVLCMYVSWHYGWQCLSVGWSVHLFGSD